MKVDMPLRVAVVREPLPLLDGAGEMFAQRLKSRIVGHPGNALGDGLADRLPGLLSRGSEGGAPSVGQAQPLQLRRYAIYFFVDLRHSLVVVLRHSRVSL